MSDEKVAHIFGGPVIQRQVDEQLVAELEHTLEMAKSGEIVGMTSTLLYYDESTSFISLGIHTRSTLGCLSILQRRIQDLLG